MSAKFAILYVLSALPLHPSLFALDFGRSLLENSVSSQDPPPRKRRTRSARGPGGPFGQPRRAPKYRRTPLSKSAWPKQDRTGTRDWPARKVGPRSSQRRYSGEVFGQLVTEFYRSSIYMSETEHAASGSQTHYVRSLTYRPTLTPRIISM